MTQTAPAQQVVGGPTDFNQLPPRIRLLLTVNGKRLSQVVFALAKLGVADHLADGPRSVAELAGAVEADPDALYRTLRCAASFGIFTELPDERFALTPTAEPLRRDAPDSLREAILYSGEEVAWRPYGGIVHSIQTGRPAFDEIYGVSFWEYADAHPELAELFDRAMDQLTGELSSAVLAHLDLSRFDRVMDVGGGRGRFLAEILVRFPKLRGALFERNEVIASAGAEFDRLGVADRAEIYGGDFFDGVPGGYDAYLIKQVLHNWSDPQVAKILGRLREAAGDRAQARLFILEAVVAPANAWDQAKYLDIEMLVKFGGRERSLAEWVRLIEAAGFELVDTPLPGPASFLECRPR